MRHAICLSLVMAAVATANAACPSTETMSGIARQWQKMVPARGIDKDMTMVDANCARQKMLLELAKTQGRIVGYKAGLTNTAVQKRFGTDGPVLATLFDKMLLTDGVELPAKFGSRPVIEADLMVEVKDEGVNEARTPAEALQHISKIIPFIELPDLVLDPKEPLNGATLTAINVGARLGVMGQPLVPTAAHLDALASMSVVVRDKTDGNNELARSSGSAILNHPLNAVIWIAHELAREGGRLKAGDLLSLGSFSPLLSPKPGMSIQVNYEGLPDMPSVGVKFQ